MNLVQRAVSQGGKLHPLIIPDNYAVFGAMNPSVFIDSDGDVLVNLRIVNYTLYHAENEQKFPSPWGPLAYLHPEKDMRLATENYLCLLDDNLEVVKHTKVEMLNLHEAIWDFHGLEDARLVQWDGKYYLCGVRRDTTNTGQGRMEYSQIELDKEAWTAKEISRLRIPAPNGDYSYCEKNWMPVLDNPYNFVKWSSPTEVVWANPEKLESNTLILKENSFVGKDQRGGSHVFAWGDYYMAFTHEVNFWLNYLKQKDAIYRHRLLVWDKEWNLLGTSNPFSFLEFRIEFCVGATMFNDKLLLSFSTADNAAFILELSKETVDELVQEALDVK